MVEEKDETIANIFNFVKKNVLSAKGLAIGVALAAAWFAYSFMSNRIIPMTYGTADVPAIGAQTADLVGFAVSALVSVVSFFISRFTGVAVNPEIIQAVVAFQKDPTNEDAKRRLGTAIVGYTVAVLKQHPENGGAFVLQILMSLVGAVNDPAVKEILGSAATALAANEFKFDKAAK